MNLWFDSMSLVNFIKYISKKSKVRSNIPPLKDDKEFFCIQLYSRWCNFPILSYILPKSSISRSYIFFTNTYFQTTAKIKKQILCRSIWTSSHTIQTIGQKFGLSFVSLFKIFLTSGSLPQKWKFANAIPIYKKKVAYQTLLITGL